MMPARSGFRLRNSPLSKRPDAARIAPMKKTRRLLKSLLFIYRPYASLIKGTKPAALFLALCITAPILSCAGREIEEPVVNTDAVTPGASVAANVSERDSDGAPASEKSGTVTTAPPLEHIAPASRDSDTWFLVTDVNAERKFAVYVDTSTINAIEGEVYSWSRLVFKEDQKDTDGLVYREVMVASAVNCGEKTYAYKSSKFYDSLGKMVYMENIGTNKSPIPANSVSASIAEFVCGYNPKDAKGVQPAPGPAKTPEKSK